MPKCTQDKIDFGRLGRRVIEADFSGGDLSGDGGLLLLRQVDEHLGLSRAAAAAIPDPRDPERIRHGLRQMLAQRLYGLCCGHEDLNDHKQLSSKSTRLRDVQVARRIPESLVSQHGVEDGQQFAHRSHDGDLLRLAGC